MYPFSNQWRTQKKWVTSFLKGPPGEILRCPLKWERPRQNKASISRIVRITFRAVISPVNTV